MMKLTAPVLLVIIIRRKQFAARDGSKSPSSSVDDGVTHDTSDETVSDRV